MIDYGLSCAYNTQLMESEGVSTKSLIGTPLFASKNAHLGLALTRADDLESLGYSLIYLSCGMLPWTHISVSDKEAKCHIIGKIKNELTVADLCKDMDDCFLRYFEYVFALATNQTPDYSYLDSIFAIKKMGSNSDSKLQSISLDEEMENDERSIACIPYIARITTNDLRTISKKCMIKKIDNTSTTVSRENEEEDDIFTFNRGL